DRKILGRIVDKETNKPVKNANVAIAGTTKTTATNFIGYFELIVGPADKTLNITHVGYATTSLDIPASEKFQLAIASRYISLNPIYLDEYPKNLATVPVAGPKNLNDIDEYIASPSEGFDRFYVSLGNAIDRTTVSSSTNVEFTIDIAGKAIDIKAVDSTQQLYPTIIHALNDMPAWNPAYQKGTKVPLTFIIGILPNGPGDVIKKILKQLQKEVNYPLAARRTGLDGFVDLVFKVDDYGKVTDLITINDPGSDLGNEIRQRVQQIRVEDLKQLKSSTGSGFFQFTAVFGLDQAPKRSTRPVVPDAYVIPELIIIGSGSPSR
ncbi:MAG TPA: carboxypeptidase-like regulatory domain-containing protein, partial [Cyclobacteriaceae bacterium]